MSSALRSRTEDFLADLVAEVSELDRGAIVPDADFQEFGLDSRFVITMNAKLEQFLPNLPRTIFFEYPSIRAVAEYLVDEYQDLLRAHFSDVDAETALPQVNRQVGRVAASDTPPLTDIDLTDIAAMVQKIPLSDGDARPAILRSPSAQAALGERSTSHADGRDANDIAIIGVAGRYPKARNIDEFWRNLREGRDCVELLPNNRWDGKPGDPLRWGGYLDGVADFDALFFGISPREAETMDPQERLFMEVAWEAMENAGYDPLRLAKAGEPASVGVFVGVMYGEYQIFGAELTLLGRPTLLSSSYATIANRVSYFLNLSGPSMALDTMCSSSLTALHLACASLRAGDCDVAIAGGTNVSIHPNKYRLLEAGKYLASDGRCRSYGADGDGYVPAEAVGAVVVKRLADAKRDGDAIWAVVRGTSLNHGGRARGYTTPNPSAQAASFATALRRAGVEPDTIGYIEGHGTGTSLGDPIEVRGIQKALGPIGTKIPIGSVKSNIGHAESAAGIASLTKVLLQFRAKQLVPSIHCEPPNSNIDFDRAPIEVQRSAAPWMRKSTASGDEVPRRAVICAFGAGGSNAHVIVEEAGQIAAAGTIDTKPRLFVLSARSEERLRTYVEVYLDFFSRLPPLKEADAARFLYDMCATLALGRTPFEARLGIIAEGLRPLQQRLAAFAHGKWTDSNILFGGRAHEPTEGQHAGTGLLDIARRWVGGQPLDAKDLFQYPWRKVALPTYPFERRSALDADLYKMREAPAVHSKAEPASATATLELAEPLPVRARNRAAGQAQTARAHDAADVVQEFVRDLVSRLLGVDRVEIRSDAALFDYGLESVTSVELAERINATLGIDITPTIFFEFRTLADFSRHLVARYDISDRLVTLGADPGGSARLPGAAVTRARTKLEPELATTSIEALWANAVCADGGAETPAECPPGAAIERREIAGVDGRRVEFAMIGAGDTLFVLGGLLATHEALTLNPDVLSIAGSHRMVMVHPPGAGRSDLPLGELTMDFIVRQIEAVQNELGLGSVALVGYSFGGLVAQAYVASFPGRVSELVLVCTTSEPASVVQGMDLVVAEAQRHPDGLRALQFADLAKFPLYAELSTRLTAEMLTHRPLPTLIVAGADDRYIPASHAHRLAGKPNAKLHLVAGAGHFLGLSHGDVLVSLVREFLADASEAPAPRLPNRSLHPMSDESLDTLRHYLDQGELASGADVSAVAAQVAFLTNRILTQEEEPADPYHCFFIPSGIEAIDAALRYARRRLRSGGGGAERSTFVYDPDWTLRRHFEFLRDERLFPDLIFFTDARELLRQAHSAPEFGAALVAASCDPSALAAIVQHCREHGAVSIVAENQAGQGEVQCARLKSRPDVIVLDEGLTGHQLPFGVCAIRDFLARRVWTTQPDEFAIRVPGSMMGPTLAVARESILRQFPEIATDNTLAVLRSLAVDHELTKRMHRRYVNPVLVDSLEAFGLAPRLRHADLRGYEIDREDGSVRVTNLYLITSGSFRGHTGSEFSKSVVAVHERTKDYMAELEQVVAAETGFDCVLPAASPATVVESALKVGLLAARKGATLLVLRGSPVFTQIGALVSAVEPGSPLEPLVERCAWANAISVDPFASDAATRVEQILTGGEVGLVWFESLQSDWGALRAIPQIVLDVIQKHRTRFGYIVGVDETYTSIGCGRMFHWQGRLAKPDIVSVCVGWTDSQMVGGYVLTTQEIMTRAQQRNEKAVAWMKNHFRYPLLAHASLQFLDRMKREAMLAAIADTSKRFAAALAGLAANCPLIRRVWGEGLFWAVEFDLDGWPRFLRDWFASFVWSECLRDPAPIAVSMQPLTPACIRLEPRCDMPLSEMDAAVATLQRVLSRGVQGIVTGVTDDLERRGDHRRAELFKKAMKGFKAS
jgi:3-oxoacyl-(acyl-carrier-protein) synthase/pimeloyl-ACP methyl ester carboxylesterase/acetylornithine/succinyldiaminopimelate/putrescine aminotransferase/acyl carrier protein